MARNLKKILATLLAIVIIFSTFGTSLSVFASINKEDFIYPIDSPDPNATKISTVDDLLAIKNDLYGNYVLTNDIDLSSYGNWDPIGKLIAAPFCGKLDGQGYKIKGLTINVSIDSASLNNPAHAVGLFGLCDGARIQNLALTNVSVTITSTSGYIYNNVALNDRNIYAGAIAGYLSNNSVINNSYATGNITAKASGEALGAYAGGLVGYSDLGIVSYSYSNCIVKATTENQMLSAPVAAGGIVGISSSEGIINCCYNTGSVTSSTLDYGDACAGGLVGKSDSASHSITNSFNEGAITAKAGNLFSDNAYSGGIAGYYCGNIDKTYNSGTISASASSYTGGNSYAGGIAAYSSSDSLISNSVIAQTSVSASASGSKYIYRISNGGTKSNNATSSSYTSGSTNDADYSYAMDDLKTSAPYSSLSWDFGSIWAMIEGKDFPQLKTVEAESESNSEDYIRQHLNFIDSSMYSDVLSKQRWAQTYWSEQNTVKANKTEALYTGFNVAVDLVNLRFPDLFDNGNIYEVIVADYVANQGASEEIQHISEITYPGKLDEKYTAVKNFIESNWQDAWGELSDEDIFWLCHYKDRTSEEWVNSDFPNNIEAIVSDTKNSGVWFETIVGVSTETADILIEQISNFNDYISWVNSCIDFSAQVDAFMSASEEFKEILQVMYDNLPEHNDKSSLKRALLSYTNFLGDSKETMALEMWARFSVETWVENIFDDAKELVEKKTNEWVESALSAKALATLKAIGWVADQAMNIYELITNQGELQEYRELLKANCYFELAMYETLKIIESDFIGTQTFEDAKLFDAAFKFLKETEIYSMNIYAKFLDTYQNSLIVSIQNGSNSTMASQIEELLINRRTLYNTMCHGLVYTLGGKVITVACPTDVNIYHSNNETALSIVNNSIVTCDENIDVFISDGMKFILLPLGEEFVIDIDATADGKMEYCVSEYDTSSQNIQTILYNNVKLVNGEGYTGSISSETNATPESYNLISDNEETVEPTIVISPEDDFVSVEKIEFAEHQKKIMISDSFEISYEILPYNASVDTVLWLSSNEKIATVDDSGVVTAVEPGTVYITAYSLCDGVTDYIEVTVVDPNSFEIITTEVPDGYTGIDYKYNLTATKDVTKWIISDGALPEGISLSENGTISGIPSAEGNFDFTVVAENEAGDTTEQDLTISVAVGASPVIVTQEIPAMTIGNEYKYKLSATGTPNDITWSLVSGRLPNGIQLLSTGIITGVATETGIFKVVVGATNGVEPDTAIELEVVSNRPVLAEGDYENMSWVLYENGELIVTGNGKIADFSSSGSPWYEYAKQVKTVNFSGEITSIGSYTFEDCVSLERLIIPDTVTSIGEYALSGCTSLTELTVPFVGSSRSATKTYDAVFGHIFGRVETGTKQYYNSDSSTLYSYNYDIPQSLKKVIITDADIIPFGAFHNCNSITEVILNDGITNIGGYAFSETDSLTAMVIPESVVTIDENAFYGCDSIASLTIPFVGSSRTATGTYDAVLGYIFGRTESGTVQYHRSEEGSLYYYNYAIPDSLVEVIVTDDEIIPMGAFHNCSNLTNIVLNEGITTIGEYAFANASAITKLTIPNSVQTIGEKALLDCTSLETLTMPFVGSSRDATGTYDAVFGHIFGRANEGTVQYYSLVDGSLSGYRYAIVDSLKNVVITDDPTIALGAFSNCTTLSTVDFKEATEGIENCAFYGVSALNKLIIRNKGCSIYNSSNCIGITGTMYGYTGSTAETFANSYSITFVPLDDEAHTHTGGTANCKEQAKCTVCGESYGELDADNHKNIVTDAAVAATCSTTGLTEGSHCDVCGEVIVAQTATDKIAHTEETIPAVNATCSQAGLTEGTKCSICGEVLVAQAETEKLAHTGGTANCKEQAECSVCGTPYGELDADNHKNIVTDAAVAATCSTTGLTEGSHCDACGDVIVAQTATDKIAHTEETIPAVNATCSQAGLTEGTKCLVCGDVLVAQKETEKLAHTGGTANCKEQAKCTVCGESYGELDADNHKNIVTDAAVAATCSSTGLTEGSHCDACGDVIVVQTATNKIAHTEETIPAVDATCSQTGLTEGTKCSVCGEVLVAQAETEKLAHTGGTANCKEQAECSVCGTPYGELDADNHKNVVTDKAVVATCSKTGLTEGSHCDACGEVIVAQTATDKIAHTEETIPAVDATCSQAGLTEGTKCSVCGEVLVAQAETEKLAHTGGTANCKEQAECSVCGTPYGELDADNHKNVVTDKAVVATCSKTGLTEGSHCDACGEVIVAQTATDKIAHTEETIPAVDATCSQAGLTEGTKCSVCGEVLVAQTETAKLAHSYKSSVTASTCMSSGYTTFTCSVCEDSYKSNETPKLGHAMNEFVVTKQPTCSEKGTKVSECSRCDYSETQSINTTEHSYKDGVCEKCGNSKVQNCDHLCHKSGFMGFIWKIVQFFWKLFKMNPVCDCGVAHY